VNNVPIPLLHELTQTAASARPLAEVFEAALDCLQATSAPSHSAILLADHAGQMSVAAWRKLSPRLRAAAAGQSAWDSDASDAQPLLVPDVALAVDPWVTRLRSMITDDEVRALALIPIAIGERLLGAMLLCFAAPRVFAEWEPLIATTIGTQVAFAIDRHRMRGDHQFRSDILAGEKRTLEMLARGAPLATVLDSVVGVVEDLGNRSSPAALMLLDAEGKLHTAASRGLPEAYLQAIDGLPADASVGTCCMAAATGVPIVTPDIAAAASWKQLAQLPLALGLLAAWSQPILARDGSVLGTLGTYFRQTREPTARDRQAVELLAHTAAVAIEQDRERQHQHAQGERIEAMFHSTMAGIAHLDWSGTFVDVNERYCALTGRTRHELLATDIFAITHPEDQTELRKHMEALLRGERHFTIERRFVWPTSASIWVSSSISALRDTAGSLTGLVAITTDVTERRAAEDAVRESEQRYRQLLEAIGLAVYTTDAEGRITLFNDAAVALWGRTPELGVDQWCGSYRVFTVEGQPMPLEECPMGVALRENRAIRGQEIVIERPDGTRARVLPHPTPLRDAAGVLTGAVNVLVDITPLTEARQELETALQAKDDFLGQVSHELRTPLTQLVGNAEILIRRWLERGPETRNESLDAIHDQALRLQRLIDNMLVLSRAERGILGELEPALVQRLLEATAVEFTKRFPGTALNLEIARDLPPVESSASTIDQILWNLLTNAHKYGKPGGPITLTARLNDGQIEVRVLDEGPRISDEDFAKLFSPYFRSSATAQAAGGLGLGLSVCKRLIEAQHGKMWALRREPRGMEFGVRLPALRD
jgi:PAS domain S-box-containing protein